MLMRLMSKGEYLIVPKGTKFTGSGKLGLRHYCKQKKDNPCLLRDFASFCSNFIPILKMIFLPDFQQI